MTRTKTKVAKYVVSVTATQDEALKKLMADDMQENVSAYFGIMIAELTRYRASNQRRPVGRPKKDGEDEEDGEVKYYPCPYDEKAPPYTMDELKAYYEFRHMPVPPQPAPYTREQLKKWDM